MAEMIVSQKIIVYNNLVFSERVYVKPRRKKNGTGTCKGGNDGRYPWSAAPGGVEDTGNLRRDRTCR